MGWFQRTIRENRVIGIAIDRPSKNGYVLGAYKDYRPYGVGMPYARHPSTIPQSGDELPVT